MGSLHKRMMSENILLERVQRQTFSYFWEGGHPVSGLARDRQSMSGRAVNDLISIAGSGFGILSIIVAVHRGWIKPAAAVERIHNMLTCLEKSPRFHGMFAHFINGTDGSVIAFRHRDDGGDVVETALLFQGLLCARQFFDGTGDEECRLRQRITKLWQEVEWDWYARAGDSLYWHWSPRHAWALDHRIEGWNEGLIAYVLAASSPSHAISAQTYQAGFCQGAAYHNGNTYYGHQLPLGMPYGGPLFIAHYAFCGLDPRGLRDPATDYWQQNTTHAAIHYAHCLENPHGFKAYGEDCWGLSASHGPKKYVAFAPDMDFGVIAPTASLSSMPYLPEQSMQALHGLFDPARRRLWGKYGFVDAFCESQNWVARTWLSINQGPIIIMIENHRSGLLWNLFMSIPEIQAGLIKLGFDSPHIRKS